MEYYNACARMCVLGTGATGSYIGQTLAEALYVIFGCSGLAKQVVGCEERWHIVASIDALYRARLSPAWTG